MRARRHRALLDQEESDPFTFVANLFDIAMVLSVALLVGYRASQAKLEQQDLRNSQPLDAYAESGQRSAGDGQRLGVAYRLPDGRIVYVPE